ncbi:hypothetical protein OIY81_376 [Cryptosporidium canis]|uniref:Uncharacterized protein n=1 Tax=Cryptosporidium canis TaxID=195482 RepID=A0ABQ8PB40_9CRYT|nr:hypothetical protein OJ252_1428 [Cryptosporidium canis]KAJ1614645.1 hypothetical protein OIY81_376 [Cryptosporidium canis]
MLIKEDSKPFEINSFLSDFRSQISKRKKRVQELSSSKNLDIFADSRARIMIRKGNDANRQCDIRRLIDVAIDKPSVEGPDSPLSPFNTDLLILNEDTPSTYFEWSCADCPLYIPKMCSCGTRDDGSRYFVCRNEGCEGLLKIPHSLIQIPLNRSVNSVQSFISRNMEIPNSLLIYYGKLKNSLTLVVFDREQEKNVAKCLSSSSDSIGCVTIYDIIPDNNRSRSSRRPYTTRLKYTGQIHNLYK